MRSGPLPRLRNLPVRCAIRADDLMYTVNEDGDDFRDHLGRCGRVAQPNQRGKEKQSMSAATIDGLELRACNQMVLARF